MTAADWLFVLAFVAVVLAVLTEPAVKRYRKRMIERARPVRPYICDRTHAMKDGER
jgi:predicted PurR-regulated permease PerM